MSRGIIRKPSFNKIVGAYRSQWKRFWMRLFSFGLYGKKGMGWLQNPKKAWYNFWYNRTSISIYKVFGIKPSWGTCFFAMLIASVASIVASPVDITKAGIASYKVRKKQNEQRRTPSSKKNESRSNGATTNPTQRSTNTTISSTSSRHTASLPSDIHQAKKTATPRTSPVSTTCARSAKNTSTPKTATQTILAATLPHNGSMPTERETMLSHSDISAYFQKPQTVPPPAIPAIPVELDESTPKSKPKNEGDQYIRKRMTVAGSFYCNQAVVSSLSEGVYLDLQPEPDNPYDKNAIALMYQGTKIGYIRKEDVQPFALSLKLHRTIYGVITAIREINGRKEIEYETWFSKGH